MIIFASTFELHHQYNSKDDCLHCQNKPARMNGFCLLASLTFWNGFSKTRNYGNSVFSWTWFRVLVKHGIPQTGNWEWHMRIGYYSGISRRLEWRNQHKLHTSLQHCNSYSCCAYAVALEWKIWFVVVSTDTFFSCVAVMCFKFGKTWIPYFYGGP